MSQESPHIVALRYINKYLTKGVTREVIPDVGTLFVEIPSIKTTCDEALGINNLDFVDNTIIHLLVLHGVDKAKEDKIIANTVRKSRRVLLLTRLPRQPDTRCYNVIARENLQDRNLLTVIEGISPNSLPPDVYKLQDDVYDGFGYERYDKLLYTSEYIPGRALLSECDRSVFEKHKGDHWLICGGFMFLQYIAECHPLAVHVVDRVDKQIVAAETIRNAITKCDTINGFDEYILQEFGEISPNIFNEWVNLLKLGSWRKEYNQIRKCNIYLYYGELANMPISDNSIVYTSTVEPEQWPRFKGWVIEAYTKRNTPVLKSYNSSELI